MLKATVGIPLEQSRMAHGSLVKRPPVASPMNRPTFKLPAVIQRPSDSARKRQSGTPLRRVLGSKRLHYFIMNSTPTRTPVVMTPDGRHDSKSDQLSVEGVTARNLSLDLGGVDSPLIVAQKTSDLITPSPMSIIATPRAPHKYFDQESVGLGSQDSKATSSSSPATTHRAVKAAMPSSSHSATRSGTRGSAFQKQPDARSQDSPSSSVLLNSPKAAEAPSSQAKTPHAPKRLPF